MTLIEFLYPILYGLFVLAQIGVLADKESSALGRYFATSYFASLPVYLGIFPGSYVYMLQFVNF
jgi:hypothetical protein